MNYLNKRKALKQVKNNPNADIIRVLIKHSKLLKLKSYNEIVEQIKDIENKKILDYLLSLINLDIYDSLFEILLQKILKIDSIVRMKLCYNLINDSYGDVNYLHFIYMYFFEIEDINKLGYYVDYVTRDNELRHSDYKTIIPKIFSLDQIERINIICNLMIRYSKNSTNYEKYINEKIFTIANDRKLEILGNFMLDNTDLPDYKNVINKLIEIDDIKLLEEMCNILEDDDFKFSEYFNYVSCQLFNIGDPIRLKLVGKIAIDSSVLNLSDYKTIVKKVLLIEDYEILEGIINLLDQETFCESRYFKQMINKIIKINDPVTFNEFSTIILSLKNERYIECINNLNFEDEYFSKIIKLIYKIIRMFELEINLNKKSILNIIFIKILSLPNCKMMVCCLEELENLVFNNLKDDVIEKNTVAVSETIDKKIEDAKRRCFVKENKEA